MDGLDLSPKLGEKCRCHMGRGEGKGSTTVGEKEYSTRVEKPKGGDRGTTSGIWAFVTRPSLLEKDANKRREGRVPHHRFQRKVKRVSMSFKNEVLRKIGRKDKDTRRGKQSKGQEKVGRRGRTVNKRKSPQREVRYGWGLNEI